MNAHTSLDSLPAFLTADETALLSIGRRLLVRSDVLLDYLRQKSAPSLEK